MRFLIADDHPLYREAVRSQIERLFDGSTVHEISSIDELYALPGEGGDLFDLFLIDLYMPGMSSEALRRVVARYPGTPVAVISGGVAATAVRECVAAGARGFIPKTATGDQFAHAVQLLLAGGTTVPAEVMLTPESAPVRPHGLHSNEILPALADGWPASLNERELGVLRGVARGQSNKQIARDLGLAEVTVKFHLRVLFRKLGVSRRAQVAVAASQAGIL